LTLKAPTYVIQRMSLEHEGPHLHFEMLLLHWK